MKLTKLRIKNHHLFKDADINLKNSDGEVLNTVVLAGSNGSGKTTLLKMIYDILTYENNQHDSSLEFTLENIADLKIKNMVYKLKEEFGNDKLYNKNYIFNRLYQKKLNEDLENKKIKLIYMPTEINFSNMNVETRNYTNQYKFSNIIDQNIINDIPSFLVTKINSEIYKNEDLPIKQAIKKICDEINIIYSILDLDIKMIGVKKDEENLPLFKNKFGAEFDINSLSSGEKQLFVRAMTLKMLNVNNSIILIDEPEISLHPKWQQRVVKVYENIGENNQIIIATHSPHVVSSVKVESLKLLSKSSDDGVEIIDGENLDGALGLPVDVVLKELMGVDTIRDPEVEEKLKYLRDLVRRDKFLTVEFKESYNELKELLGTIDQDMILIDMAIARKKVSAVLNINKTIEPEFMKKYKKKYKPKNWADYRNDGIRGKIKKYVGDNEQSYKENYICVYCERKVDLDNNSSHIEHIKPKGAKFSNEFQNYMNLSLCCNSKESCGETKGHKYSDKFVNPVEMNPKDYFTYDEMTLEIISKKSELNEFKNETVDDILKLNNYKLLKARKEVFKMLEQAKQYGYLEHQIESFDQFPTLIEFYKENFL